MKALSIRQPWAELILRGEKTREVRTRPPPKSVVGTRVYLHASGNRDSKTIARCEAVFGAPGSVFLSDDGRDMIKWLHLQVEEASSLLLPFGAIVGTMEITGSEPVLDTTEPGPWEGCGPGDWLWDLAAVRRITPATWARGRLGFWEWEPSNG